jgi:hypothetical protein
LSEAFALLQKGCVHLFLLFLHFLIKLELVVHKAPVEPDRTIPDKHGHILPRITTNHP